MSFSPDWLALREPADHAARSAHLLSRVATQFGDRDEVSVVDLGCGAGSNLRGTWRALPDRQTWRLVDYDPVLLAAARQRLVAWADRTEEAGAALVLSKGAKILTVSFHQADLNGELDAVFPGGTDLVTAAALFDLVSEAWISRFVDVLASRALPLYTVLTYDGTERWDPPIRRMPPCSPPSTPTRARTRALVRRPARGRPPPWPRPSRRRAMRSSVRRAPGGWTNRSATSRGNS